MSDQVFSVPVSPAQRWVLVQLAKAEGQLIRDRREGTSLRRFMSAFALTAIDDVGMKHGRVSAALTVDRAPALFTLTAENLDYARGLADVHRLPAQEMVVGPLFDALDDVRSGKDLSAGVPAYDSANEDWAPPLAVSAEGDAG